jgi:thymidylate synthase (FAD)
MYCSPLNIGEAHLTYSFDISGVSRALLQELARHRIASPSVKSTRYTLKELKDEVFSNPIGGKLHYDKVYDYCVVADKDQLYYLIECLISIQKQLRDGKSNDKVKYMLPEAYKTELAWTINARSLQNFLALRSAKAALWEIRLLAQAIYDAIPDDHKYLFKECMQQEV